MTAAVISTTPDPKLSRQDIEVTILMPCLNEARTIGECLDRARVALDASKYAGRYELLVADNGSSDGSVQIAEQRGALVIRVPQKGYGSALQAGIAAASGRWIIMGDADCSYDFAQCDRILEELERGYAVVMGNRFAGEIKPGAMPFLHRYLGNPVLSFLGRFLFRMKCGDFHCGLRGFRKDKITRLGLRTTGMEFASEMVVRASLAKYPFAEVPVTLSPDKRGRPPHLRTWRDGWRHLRFLLLYCPTWLFLAPGAVLFAFGFALMCVITPRPVRLAGMELDVHTLVYAAMMQIVGLQIVLSGVFARVFAVSHGLLPKSELSQRSVVRRIARILTLETGLIAGVGLFLLGLAGSVMSVVVWRKAPSHALDPRETLRLVIPSALFMTFGVQAMFSSFLLGVLSLPAKRNDDRPNEL